MQTVKKPKNTALWAVDPFEEGVTLPKATVLRLARVAKNCACRMLPVHVISPALGQARDLDKIEDRLYEYFRRLHVPGFEPPQVLLDDSFPRQSAVHTLSEFARKQGASWIAVSSHGRHGWRRLVMGSFAETLLNDTTLPLLFLGTSATKGRKERVLYPTDFSRGSWNAFTRFLPVAKAQKAEIVFFHVLSFPATARDGMGIVPYIPEGYFSDQEAAVRKLAARWLAAAEKAGVPARLRLQDGGLARASGADMLAAAAREKATFITITAESGTVGRFLAGSTAFDIFREGSYFVWVYGPKACASAVRLQFRRGRPIQSFRRGRKLSDKSQSARSGSARYKDKRRAPPPAKARWS